MTNTTNTTPAQIRAYAKLQGVEFDWSQQGRTYALECWAPKGKVFSATGTHFYALYGDGFHTRPDWSKTLEDLKGTIGYGFEDCDEEECDICNPS